MPQYTSKARQSGYMTAVSSTIKVAREFHQMHILTRAFKNLRGGKEVLNARITRTLRTKGSDLCGSIISLNSLRMKNGRSLNLCDAKINSTSFWVLALLYSSITRITRTLRTKGSDLCGSIISLNSLRMKNGRSLNLCDAKINSTSFWVLALLYSSISRSVTMDSHENSSSN
ncbi:hypothetical protein C4D60_Mb07t04330 [Musa balbisiana]|uniref:Uncharacterized protein n=1 Tax=Musa balbisiana TaxID=52838 RepID=A0A4S8JCV2_MUSBA|nr:hypothetical protein C4D60_Mb07t04330 [Musa balbisiana]